MLADQPPTAPVVVRVGALSAASVLLGVVAHGWVAGALPAPGALLVISTLVVLVVGALLGAGRWMADRAAPRAGAAHVADGAGVLALVVGQALVHWLILPVAEAVPVSGGHGHLHPGATGTGAVMAHHSAAGIGPQMLAGHALAALVVALLLRWVEAAILRLAGLLAQLGAPVRAVRTAIGLARGVPAIPRVDLAAGEDPRWARRDARPRMRVTLQPLGRRGPPLLAGS